MPVLRKCHSGRSGSSSLAVAASVQRFYTAWADSSPITPILMQATICTLARFDRIQAIDVTSIVAAGFQNRLAGRLRPVPLLGTMDQKTIIQRVRAYIEAAPTQTFLRRDFAHFGSARQLSRCLVALQDEGLIVRAGRGLYLRPDIMTIEAAVRAIRDRLGRRARRLVMISGVTVALGDTSERPNRQTLLDAKKLASATRVVQCCTVDQIRRKSLENIKRWNSKGTWVSAHDEWRALMECGTDQEIIAVMTGTDERSNRLRQSPPYVGLVEPVALCDVTC